MLPYLEKFYAKGKVYYYYRRNGKRLKVMGEAASPEFIESYKKIHAGFSSKDKRVVYDAESIQALVETFKRSSEYASLKPRVRALYMTNFDLLVIKFGDLPAAKLPRRALMEWRDMLAETPAKANNLIRAISRLYSFGIDRCIVTQNPAMKIKKLKLGERRPWTENEVETFLAKSSAPMRLALSLALYTGQRLGDVIKMRWNQISDGGIEVVQEKGGGFLWIPIHQKLRSLLAETPKISVQILTAPMGKPFKDDNLKHAFKKATIAAGLPGDLVFHGLRKSAAVMLAEAGCSTEQIKAITGHKTDQMAAYYARRANQKVLAKAAMERVEKFGTKP